MSTRSVKVWQQKIVDDGLCESISTKLNLPLPIISLMVQRDVLDVEQMVSFLRPTLDQLPCPFVMKGVEEAVSIILDAIKFDRKISIFADYDTDGVTAAAVLSLFLSSLGLDVRCYQPNRFVDGYGLNKTILARIHEERKDGVIITVDCGIADNEEIAEARHLGFLVIVTDHHQPPVHLPPANAIIHPLQPDCRFPFKHLAGVGVAFYLVMALRSRLAKNHFWQQEADIPNLKSYLDLVAVGTVADLVPLQGPNRILVKAGLEILSTCRRPGLYALMTICGITPENISAEDISFKISPRLNAAGRMGAADKALELLIARDFSKAWELTASLEDDNRQRRELGEEVFREASLLGQELFLQGRNSLVLIGNDWHEGVIGIVTSRIVEHFFRPTILLTLCDGTARGSGRAIPGFNLYEAMTECSDLLKEYGGHEMAVGLTLKAKNLSAFVERFEQVASERISEHDLKPRLWIDREINLAELMNHDFLRYYNQLSPFGMGNPEPVFTITADVSIEDVRIVGNNHLKLTVKDDKGKIWSGIGFGLGYQLSRIRNKTANFAFSIRQKEFRGIRRWELYIHDIRER